MAEKLAEPSDADHGGTVASHNGSACIAATQKELDDLGRLLDEERFKVHELVARNAALQDSLNAVTDKLEREKLNNVDTSAKKNAALDALRMKLNRYEFAIKEAMVFLARPQDNYDEYGWLNTRAKAAADVPPLVEKPPMSAPARDGLMGEPARNRTASSPPKVATVRTSTPVTSSGALPPAPLPLSPGIASVSFTPGHSRIASSGNASISQGTSDVKQEPTVKQQDFVKLLECMRLALTYLRNAYVTVSGAGSSGNNTTGASNSTTIPSTNPATQSQTTPPTPTGMTTSLSESSLFSERASILPRLHMLVTDATSTGPPYAEKTDNDIITNIVLTGVPLKGRRSQSTCSKHSTRSIAEVRASAAAQSMPTSVPSTPEPTHPESDEGDLASGPARDSAFSGGPVTPRACKKCRALGIQLDHAHDTLAGLKKDVVELADRLDDETSLRQRAELSKDMLDQELEQLTAQLFDQANYMVSEEARAREHFEASNRDLQRELAGCVKRLAARDAEAHNLRRMVDAAAAASIRDTAAVRVHVHVRTTPDGCVPVIPVDAVIYHEFQEHIRMAGAQAGPYATAFMKRVLTEDIEPTLSYSYHLAAGHPLFKTSGALSSSFKRRLLDGVTRGVWEVDAAALSDGTHTTPSPTTAQPVSKSRCCMCNLTRDCEFKLRFPPDPAHPIAAKAPAPADWNALCRFCRGRVCAVGDFCGYMLHLSRDGVMGPGKQGATMMGIFRHCLWLRRRMALARIGSCGLFDSVVEGRGSDGGVVVESGSSEWERYVQIVT
ncbi:hypothetical protein SeMB42_g01529 [Synchytrium endobioticum]|uniref:GDP/GTP exchange factor Sec2 N-terminal domain-containing protein n=1 Tax=Synchytrium endobioticum TaxID=286115 RepID=A0A507DKV1_9FUNG|nr:hypothetical protein SeMB42_g01529 [Synchytrium endobioticum]